MMKRILEVCAADLSSVAAAAEAGAPRVELSAALPLGGVTPSAGMMQAARRMYAGKIHVLIRARGGDFVYTDEEKQAMLADIDIARETGMDGVVIGALTPEGDIDHEFTAEAISRAGDLSITFHRAFDRCRDWKLSFGTLVGLHVDRILTSGLAPSAVEGIDTLSEICRRAEGRIGIIAAAGVNEKNVEELIARTGVKEVHSSCRQPRAAVGDESVKMGAADTDAQPSSAEIITKIMNLI